MGELNFPMTPCFTTQNCFLIKQTEKKKSMFHRETERKVERNHLMLKNTYPTPIIFWFSIYINMTYSFCGKDYFFLLSSAESLFSECTCSSSCWSTSTAVSVRVLDLTAEGHRGPFTLKNVQIAYSNLEWDFEKHLRDLRA